MPSTTKARRSREPSLPDPREVIRSCCSEGTRAVLVFDDPPQACSSRFRTLGEASVRLTLDAPAERPPRSGSLCNVQFVRGEKAGVFLTHVFSYTEDYTGEASVGLVVPTQLLFVESRRAFRVPIDGAVSVHAHFRSDGRWIDGDVLDLSRGGMRLRTAAVPEEDEVTVEVVWPDGKVVLPARIVRRGVEDVALAFLPCPQLERPDGLTALVATIERAWLRKRRERAEVP
ncbi:MAG: PilZ domain-containing protein [Myxococcota bacterium]